ncbi:hypothetical protein Q5424_17610 [Conexibacter sp. JD483]|uniref:hypothetical protein n=1 Tax=unclassified Conexibacter TaxID=2627773 RepID=UPI00271C69B1|nr:MULTISPECIES: hypothetical protein [unclassified Conexibacter]MDO8186611.1 hypothetical protein [Conexibacter sp. CPCC 205706]MDO8196716.1 hypothetical protein [Conexibacter sp. CPCC 205762]MDR9370917.1 hypothetical protein [Conexibacter sp. JD483]
MTEIATSAAPPSAPTAEEIAACNPEWDEELAREYREAYTRIPETEEERRWTAVATRAAILADPPW